MKKPRKLKIWRPCRRDWTALVDVEIILYQTCMDCLQEERVGDDEFRWSLSTDELYPMIDQRIVNAVRETDCANVVLAVGARGNWRRRLCETYKAHRDGKKKPLGYRAAVDHLREEYRVEQWDWLEADDVLGILATGECAGRCVIVSSDKDMKSVPGMHYDPTAPVPAVVEVSEIEADRNHAVLALAGDAADGYKGCQGIGEAKARKLVDAQPNATRIWGAALDAFVAAGHSREYAVEQFRLSRVLRSGEYDHETSEVKLWGPPATVANARAARVAAARPARAAGGGGARRVAGRPGG